MSTQLANQIQLIKNATIPGENTANRVGTTLELLNIEKRDTLDSFSKAETLDMINQVKALVVTGSLFVGDITPSESFPSGDLWGFAGAGTYPNAGGIVIPVGAFAILSRINSVWESTPVSIPVNSISDIQKTSTVGFVDTYTIFMTNGSTFQFTVTNGESSEFSSKNFTYVVDLTKNTYDTYTELTGSVKFVEGPNSTFGGINYVKLTGGSISFDSNFTPQNGSESYDPLKTNIIIFWKEYNRVRYFIETFTLESIPTTNFISYYNFKGKSPGTLLSSITPDYGVAFSGDTGRYSADNLSKWITQTSKATSVNHAIAINVGAIANYRVTVYLAVTALAEFNFKTTAYNIWNNFIDINVGTSSTIKNIYPGSPVGGTTLVTTSRITYPQSNAFLWEFEVIGNIVKIYFEGTYLTQYTHSNAGTYFSMILGDIGDVLQSIKIEQI
jgi:hypothetical protein